MRREDKPQGHADPYVEYDEVPLLWTKITTAADGTTYLVDNRNMALYILKDGQWKCLLTNINITHTLGSKPATLPLYYAGKGYFLFSETVYGPDTSKDGTPKPNAITYLLDSKKESIIAHSQRYPYTHILHLSLPRPWIKQYGLSLDEKSFTQPANAIEPVNQITEE